MKISKIEIVLWSLLALLLTSLSIFLVNVHFVPNQGLKYPASVCNSILISMHYEKTNVHKDARKLLKAENRKPLPKSIEQQMLRLNEAFITGEGLLQESLKIESMYNGLYDEKFHRAFESAVGLEIGSTKKYMEIYRVLDRLESYNDVLKGKNRRADRTRYRLRDVNNDFSGDEKDLKIIQKNLLDAGMPDAGVFNFLEEFKGADVYADIYGRPKHPPFHERVIKFLARTLNCMALFN